MQAGRMLYRVTILRRAHHDAPFVAIFSRRAQLIQTPAAKRLEAGIVEDQNAAVLRLYGDAQACTITVADRLKIVGPRFNSGAQHWRIDGVNLPDPRGYLEIQARAFGLFHENETV